MSVVTICAGVYCHGREVAQGVAKRLGYRLVVDETLVELAALEGKLSVNVLQRVLEGKSSLFGAKSQEQGTAIAQINLAGARLVEKGKLVLAGLGSLLVPNELPQVLRTGLIADNAYRIAQAEKELRIKPKEARKMIQRSDQRLLVWAQRLHGEDPWQAERYDILIPMDKRNPSQAVDLICRHGASDLFSVSTRESQAAKDLLLAAGVRLALVQKGHHAKARASEGLVSLEINKQVLRFQRLEAEIRALVEPLPGVKGVEVKPGAGSHRADIYRAHDFRAPAKFLLVDDERSFVETLSERLLMRDMNAAVVYDGEQALSTVALEQPEVMVLDLMMPGIDGMELLQRVKSSHPQMQVIVLTGHGSPQDRDACLAAGAFAYLQKPVDIEELSSVMRQAQQCAAKDSEDKA